ncbi:MAG TPA: SRPBCC family protein [Gaiellaceae bacterium]
MARAGDVLDDPTTGSRLVFLHSAAETGGELLEYELTFVPGGFSTRDHLHPRQSEQHEVVDGSLGLIVAGREKRLHAGDSETVPVGTQHRIFKTQDAPLRARFTLRPALDSEVLLETLFGLARDGKVGKNGEPTPLQLAVIFSEFASLGRPPRPPAAVQHAVLAPLAALGRAKGYQARYPAYSEGAPEPGEYVFVDEWHVDAPPEPVFVALADGATYPDWWRPVYLATKTDGPPELGRTSEQHFKGRLPYHLRTRSTITRYEPSTVVGAEVEGDLRGRGLWTLTPRDGGTDVRFDWRVYAEKPVVRALTPVLRPLFRWNHAWAIACAREGLEPYARRRAGSA